MSFKISVVIPTYNRAELLKACLESLEHQTLPPCEFEVIVVVDGSTDYTTMFLSQYSPPFSFKYFVQANKRGAAARNLGIKNALSDIILCLDDDMIASPELVEEHVCAHKDRQDCLVQGALKVHKSVKRTPFIKYEEKRYNSFHHEKETYNTPMNFEDISSGNISLPRKLLLDVGGFDENPNLLCHVDSELAFRLEKKNIPFRYCARALTYMTNVKDLHGSLRNSFLYGRSYVYICKKFPDALWKFSPLVYDRHSLIRNLMRRLVYLHPRNRRNLSCFERLLKLSVSITESLGIESVSGALYRLSLDYYFWKGLYEESGGLARYIPRGIPVLCYHNVSNIKNDAFRAYTLSVGRFAEQMSWLKSQGHRAISIDTLLGYLDHGVPLPAKPVVITFDDGFQELKNNAAPVLVDIGFYHTYFLNTGKIGGKTDWIRYAPNMAILSREDIVEMIGRYGGLMDFQAHGKNHVSFVGLDADTIRNEVRHCIEVLGPLIGREIYCVAYPYGEYEIKTLEAMRSLPIKCSFTVDQGLCRPGQDFHLLPRVEIFGNDFDIDFKLKVLWGWSPFSSLRRFIYEKLALKLG